MAIIKEWTCLAHGDFDGPEAVCPHGCETVTRSFRTAPGLKSDSTKGCDSRLEYLAEKYNLTDMSNRNGQSVGGNRGGSPDMAPVWGELPKGNVFEVGKGERPAEGSQGGANSIIQGMNNDSIDAMVAASGQPLPSFMDIAGTLPKVRPHVMGEHGSQADLNSAIERSE